MERLSRRQNPLVLLVEDDPGLREAVVRGLTKAGYQLASAGSRPEAVQSAHDLNPDAVVMDVLLPDGEGPAAAQEIRSQAESFNTMVETLKDTQEQLVQREKLASVGQLAAGVAHEINNPLGSVLLYADILRKETPEEDRQHREDLEMIMREATRCKVIVNDLLNFSRQNEVLAQDTELNAMIRELAEEQAKRPLFQKVEIATDLDPALNTIQADPLQLHQVFVNLMNNAAEAMPDGGKLTLRTRRGPTPGYVTLEVQDTGVGISEENMKKLFTPFFTTKPIGKGTGLGLAIIYGIVKMHRGQISVQSQVGRGTTFTILLQERLSAPREESQSRVAVN